METIEVKAGVVPGRLESFVMNNDASVADVLAQAGLDPAGYEIRVGSDIVDANDGLSDGDTVLLVKKIKGN